jgi:hypothetical protein
VAILVVALATSTAAYILWQQSLWLRQVENLNARAQVDAIGRAAANWAAAILAEDDPTVDHLGELWALPLPPLPAERATLTGTIGDEQAKFNVNDLVREGGDFQHVVAPSACSPRWACPPAAESPPTGLMPTTRFLPAGADGVLHLPTRLSRTEPRFRHH